MDNKFGEVSERFKELVLKTSDSERDRGFESHPLRFSCNDIGQEVFIFDLIDILGEDS